MENKSNKGLIVALIIAILIIIGLGCVLGYELLNKDNDSTSKSKDSNVEEKISKIDESKDYVYSKENNDNYEHEALSSELVTYFNNIASSSTTNLNVPYINLNSEDANTVNNTINKIYENTIENVNQIKKDNLSNSKYEILDYKVYYYKDYVSVIIVNATMGGALPNTDYYGYIFNTTTGELLDFSDIAKLYDKDEDILKGLFEEKIKSNEYADLECDTNQKCGDESLRYYENYYDVLGRNSGSIGEYGVIYFITEDGKLNLMTNLYIPAEKGIYSKVLTLN